MVTIKPTILHITPFFSPNIGGVETHLLDLTNTLSKLKYHCLVLTYSPITTAHLNWKRNDQVNKYLFIRRFSWIGFNLFHKLEKYPLLNFIYITPYLFLRSFLWLLLHKQKISVIHSHGINGAIVGYFLKIFFKIPKHIVSIYSSYDNVPMNSLSVKIFTFFLNRCDKILTQSDRSIIQLKQLGILPALLFRYLHWIDLYHFKPLNTAFSRIKLSLPSGFSVLFVGRLIPQKNALVLAKISHQLPQINFVFVGTGPDFTKLTRITKNQKNVFLRGNVSYHRLQYYYNSSDFLCFPSKYDEGWGRVLMESIACGRPVITSNLGAIPEVINKSVGIILKPSYRNFKKTILYLFNHPKILDHLKQNCRPYALKYFSDKNISLITRFYIEA